MGDGGVSAAFPYLNHKVPEKTKPVFTAPPKPLEYSELYSPRTPELQQINAQIPLNKSYWRTRDDITFGIYEWRSKGLMIITSRDSKPNPQTYRTIVLSLEKLYKELEAKASGSREALMKKTNKALADDQQLHKAAATYILARLNITAEPLPWPTTFELTSAIPTSEGATPADAAQEQAESVKETEKMVTFQVLSGDVEVLELATSVLDGLALSGIDPAALKLRPSSTAAAPVDSPQAPTPVSESAAGVNVSSLLPTVTQSPPSSKEKDKASSPPSKAGARAGAGAEKLPAILGSSGGKGSAKASASSTKKKA